MTREPSQCVLYCNLNNCTVSNAKVFLLPFSFSFSLSLSLSLFLSFSFFIYFSLSLSLSTSFFHSITVQRLRDITAVAIGGVVMILAPLVLYLSQLPHESTATHMGVPASSKIHDVAAAATTLCFAYQGKR